MRRVDDLGILWIDRDVGAAGVFVLVEDPGPVLAAVVRAENAALFARPVGMAEHGGEHAVGIARIDGERRNLLPVAQAEMRPRLAGVGGL